tara:strand:+ start:1450 stop:1686 length:237 start_codon:yes stop_codon:yes gene_type:complete
VTILKKDIAYAVAASLARALWDHLGDFSQQSAALLLHFLLLLRYLKQPKIKNENGTAFSSFPSLTIKIIIQFIISYKN